MKKFNDKINANKLYALIALAYDFDEDIVEKLFNDKTNKSNIKKEKENGTI